MRKKILTFALVATMTMFSTMTAFAANSPDLNNSTGTENNETEEDNGGDEVLGDDDNTGSSTNTGSTSKNPSSSTDNTEDDADDKTDVSVNDGGVVTAEEVKAIEDAVKLEGTTEKLVVSVVAKDAKDYKVVAAATELKDVKYTVIDLKFESGKQPTASTKITLPIAKLAEVKDAKFVSVYRVDSATSKLVLVDVVKVDEKGNIAFKPDHFSTYVFASATEAQYNAANTSSTDDTTKTGDTAPVAAMVTVAALAAAAGCAAVVLKKKNA